MENARERILDAAQNRLIYGGPGGLVLDAVAADARVSKGGLLYHFASKEALVEGLCGRMLERFDRDLEALSTADTEGSGAWTRAYLSSTVTAEGKPADDSGQLMAAILATLGEDSAHLTAVRETFARWHRRFQTDGIPPAQATLVRLAADGLWLSAMLGLPQLDSTRGAEVIRQLHALTHEQSERANTTTTQPTGKA